MRFEVLEQIPKSVLKGRGFSRAATSREFAGFSR
jgi:hypothetical protein